MLYLAADHRGFQLKEEVKKYLQEKGVFFEDLGNKTYDSDDDYSDFGDLVAEKIKNDSSSRGILICASGIGMSIVANRHKGVRAGLCLSSWMAEAGRRDDDVNVLVLASEITDLKTARKIIDSFLNTEFSNKERYKRRIDEVERD